MASPFTRVGVQALPLCTQRRAAVARLALGLSAAALGALPCSAGAQQPIADEIVVTASLVPQARRQIGAAVSVIDAEEIELRGYRDVADTLRTQPGIGVSNSGGAGKAMSVRIRGEENYRTLLIVDGVKALDASAPQVLPTFDSLLTTSDLQRIEVLRGPQGFIYGADAGGVVNVLTRRGAGELGGQVGLEYGDYGTRVLEGALSGGGEQGDYFVSVTDLATDGFNAHTNDTVLRDDDGADNTTLHTKLGWNVSEALRLQLVVRDIDADTAYDDCADPVTFFTTHDCRGTTEQTVYKASADYTSGSASHSFGYSDVDIVREYYANAAEAFATDGDLARFEYTGSYRPSEALGFVYGVDLQDEEVIADGGTLSRKQHGYYAEYQGGFGDALFLSLGARYDDNDDFGSHTSARASAAYVHALGAGRSLKYRASMGTGFRAPSLAEVAFNASPFASPPAAGFVLVEENSRGYDLGVEFLAAGGAMLELAYFDQEIDDEIYFDLVAYSGYLQSLGTSSSRGVELAADVPLGERWQLLVNWTRNDAENSSNEERLRRPKNLGNFGLRYRAANGRLAVIANYRVSQDSIDIGGIKLDNYAVLDLSASYDLSESVAIYGRVQNAADERYQEILEHNAAGRAAYAGVRLRF